ncbi:hypothetical protein M378DRAFT_170320 [Amanita muscaria Koide BX008]|uniref:Uncharacterized protein n=1 Tax=Amanita muscaria (strain Koide BX008) TaxID=946122 RepID=A0A0C2WBL1_AMAMK|nr:hypothetical protein M378DRAFT_170320 [Amanita muscaria Koide BX008]
MVNKPILIQSDAVTVTNTATSGSLIFQTISQTQSITIKPTESATLVVDASPYQVTSGLDTGSTKTVLALVLYTSISSLQVIGGGTTNPNNASFTTSVALK